mgnify:CR=1 FL=1
MKNIKISKTNDGGIKVSFPYNTSSIVKIKVINGFRWHPKEKHWSFPDKNGTLEKILKVFEGEEIHLDPALQTKKIPSPLVREGKGEGYNFEAFRKELVLRKYSYKTIKSYLYYNRDFLNFIDKEPTKINDNDIKDYLLYLAVEKQSATSTLNQVINALKFYY